MTDSNSQPRIRLILADHEMRLIQADAERLNISRQEAVRRRAFKFERSMAKPNLDLYRKAVASVAHIAAGQMSPTQIEAIAASVFNLIYQES